MQNPSTNFLVSYQLNSIAIRALQPTPSGSFPGLKMVEPRTIHSHDTQSRQIHRETIFLERWPDTQVTIAHSNSRPEVFADIHVANSEENQKEN